ncbi:thermonuclease family protein [Henriciella aquimarina]|uniref:thermonuclease family protein n=1 Tax=Henriciella aquimarina TaxID=545261 RepID=UPI001301ADE1|nr:thermonuclease family protein [Henriciella aquimarina]
MALFLLAACAPRSPLDAMQPGERGRVVRVIDGDALVLDTGQSVRLVGVEAPSPGGRYGDAEPHAEASARMLEDLVMGREVRLFYPGLTRDRYDRALAHVKTADGAGPAYWVNLELVRRGGVRVRLYPDTDAGGEILMKAEREARAKRLGLWQERAYAIGPATDVGAAFRGFTIVEGVFGATASPPPADEADDIRCTRQMQGASLLIDIAFSARSACDMPSGTPVRLRGWTSDGRMELVHPLHVETPEPG